MNILYFYTLTLTVLLTHHSHTSQAQNVEMIKLGWDAIVAFYTRYTEQNKQPPVPLLVFYDSIADFNHMLPVIWSENIESDQMSVTPLEELYSAIPDLLHSYSKKNEITPSKCKLFYKFGGSKDSRNKIYINSHNIIVDMLNLKPDYNERRRIFVECPGVPLQNKCANDQCKADQEDEYNKSSTNNQYHLAMNAYRHAKAHQIKHDEEKYEKYEKWLEDMELAGFVVTSEATRMVQQDVDAYMGQLEVRGKAFGWDDRMMISAKDAASAKDAQFAEKDVEFDQKNWKLRGKFRRLASFLNDDGTKITWFVTTSKFECDIPQADREQSFIGKWVTNTGTVKNSFKKKILYIMQADGQQAGEDSLMLPQEYEYTRR